jgi:hypothetical protein
MCPLGVPDASRLVFVIVPQYRLLRALRGSFGMQGVSQAQFFAQFLGNIKLNDAPVDWAAVDLRYLLKVRYGQSRVAPMNGC